MVLHWSRRARGLSRGRAAVFFVFLALAGAASAQDKDEGLGGADKPVTEEMVRLCPELKDAVGRKKAQLVALYFELDWRKAGEEATKKRVAGLFDLSNKDDTELLVRHATLKEGSRCQRGIRAIVGASDAKGFAWVLERFAAGKPLEKGRWIDALAAVPYRECARFLEKSLDDKTEVPDWKASQEAPPGYKHLRVCDWALRTLGAKLIDTPAALPKDLADGQVSSMMKVEERDARIAKTKAFLAESKAWKELVAKCPSVLAGADDATKKAVTEAMEKVGLKAE